MVRPTVNSRKHIFQLSPITQAVGTINNLVIAEAKQDVGDGTNTTDVIVGSVIKAVHIEMWCLSDDAMGFGSTNITVEKVPSAAPLMNFGNSQALFLYPNKNNVLYITQGLVADQNSTPLPFIRQWIAIPKGKQRMSLGDRIVVNLAGITGVTSCLVMIYKEYF